MTQGKKLSSFCQFLLWLLLIAPGSFAANKYMVVFSDKKDVQFDPYEYFHPKAIERRIKHGIPLIDPTDLPVNGQYVSRVKAACDSLVQVSRWMNAAIVFATEDQLKTLYSLPFVKDIEALGKTEASLLQNDTEDEATVSPLSDPKKLELLLGQTSSMQGGLFAARGFTGKGIRVAIFDAGFPGVDKHKAFDHIRKDNRIKATWDFVKGRENVYGFDSHGTAVLSCVAGKCDSLFSGMAPDAEFFLARTERGKLEPFSEEENWLAAAEWADKNGVDIINSSLGYTDKRYFPEQMDGRTSLVARAARVATRKGILVVNSAGNDGSGKWHIVGTPADVDSVLSIGGVDPKTYVHIDFSSYGPLPGGGMKPNVCAFGEALTATPSGGWAVASGTSFSSPLVAGFAACALQSNPKMTNMQLFRMMEQSATLYPYFDYAHGYGIPQAAAFTDGQSVTAASPTFDVVLQNGYFNIIIQPAELKDVKKGDKLFYHVRSAGGVLRRYAAVAVNSASPLQIPVSDLKPGDQLSVKFKSYLYTKKFDQ